MVLILPCQKQESQRALVMEETRDHNK